MKLEGTHGGRMIGSVLSRNLVPDGDYTPTQERTMEHNRRQGARSDPQEKTNVFFFSSSCSAGPRYLCRSQIDWQSHYQ